MMKKLYQTIINTDDYWDHDVDPKSCKNLKDFFKQRIKARINERKEKQKKLENKLK